MSNNLLYLTTVLIWGSTWLAIKFQLGEVPPELSVVYRFSLASILLFAYSAWRRLPLRFTPRQHAFIALQGLLLFSANYIMVYFAELYITSGLVAVIFSSIIMMNVFLAAIFLGTPVRAQVVLGGLIGISGLVLIFWPELGSFSLGPGRAFGLVLAVLSSISASFGNIVSARNQRNALPVIQTNAYGMAYGAAFTLLIALVRGVEFSFDASAPYLLSLLYLALFGSVVAFGAYLTLLGRIGPGPAAYITVLFPVIALLLSVFFEDFALNPLQLVGVALVLAGNVVVLAKRTQAAPAAAR
jgi:drug/metabolite transporter (DMT)-like permease